MRAREHGAIVGGELHRYAHQQQRGRDLADDERAELALRALPASPATAAFFQTGDQVCLHREQGRRQPHHLRHEKRECDDAADGPAVDRETGKGQHLGRQMRAQRVDAPQREHEAAPGGERAQQQTFGEELPGDPPAACAEGEPHRHLRLPAHPAGQHHAGDIFGREDEQRPAGGEQHRHAQRRDTADLAFERHQPKRPARVRPGSRFDHVRRHAPDFVRRLGERHARLQTRDRPQPPVPAIAGVGSQRQQRPQGERPVAGPRG